MTKVEPNQKRGRKEKKKERREERERKKKLKHGEMTVSKDAGAVMHDGRVGRRRPHNKQHAISIPLLFI